MGCNYYTPHTTKLLGGILVSLRPSVRLSRIHCPLCSAYTSGWIHFIFIHLIKQLQKVCRLLSFLQNLKIWIFGNCFKFVTLTLSCFDLGSDVNSMGNHVAVDGISECRHSSLSLPLIPASGTTLLKFLVQFEWKYKQSISKTFFWKYMYLNENTNNLFQ